MTLDLDTLKDEILATLAEEQFVVFHGYSRHEPLPEVLQWDAERHPDFRMFLAVARELGVKLMVFYHRSLTADMLDEAMEQVEESDLPPTEAQGLRRRLRDLRRYEDRTAEVELSFDHLARIYLFSLTTDWFEDFLEVQDELCSAASDEEYDEGAGGEFFSRN